MLQPEVVNRRQQLGANARDSQIEIDGEKSRGPHRRVQEGH